ncbi:MAG: hypothetical protein K8W52_27240 [Deltaproteobacteria bacterium]|nr:hypothetical protein [Deltaproteobacteria bacterium]
MRVLAAIAPLLLVHAAHADTPSPLPACPKPAAVKGLLGLGPDDVIASYVCVPGTIGRAAWAVEVYVTHPRTSEIERITRVLDASTGATIATETVGDIADHEVELAPGVALFAADLDADGRDELLRETPADGAGGVVSRDLLVFAVDGDALVSRGRLALAYDNRVAASDPGAQVVCSSSWSLRRRGKGKEIAVRGTVTRQPRGQRDTCPVAGKHAYVVRAGALVRVR